MADVTQFCPHCEDKAREIEKMKAQVGYATDIKKWGGDPDFLVFMLENWERLAAALAEEDTDRRERKDSGAPSDDGPLPRSGLTPPESTTGSLTEEDTDG